jgi:hypothetical protein
MKRLCFFLSILLIVFTSNAQDDKIDADRPDQTESSVNTPRKYFQAEFGFGKLNYLYDNFTAVHPTFLLKYGLTKRVELRLEGNFQSDYEQLIPNPLTTTVFGPVEIGTRIGLFEEKGLRPKTALLFHLGLPFTSTMHDANQKLFPSFRFCFQNSLSDHVALGYNVGAQWDGYDNTPTWFYTFVPGFNIGERWYAFAEVFGFLKEGTQAETLIDTGLAYDFSDNTRIDISVGKGLGDSQTKNFFAIGFSFRVPTSKHAGSSTH